jgi:hypothetical protein
MGSFKGLQIRALAGQYKYGCRTGPPGWESIPGLLNRSTNTGFVSNIGATFSSLKKDLKRARSSTRFQKFQLVLQFSGHALHKQ